MNFETKYKKYKQKYLELQKQTGGHLLNPVDYELDPNGGYGKLLIKLDSATPNEIFERPIIYQESRMFIDYRQSPTPGIFELSNTFFSGSRQIFNSIVEHIRVLPAHSWIMCIRYTNKDGSFGDCQIGVSGAVNLVDISPDGIIDLKKTALREIEEESGLRIAEPMACGAIQKTTDSRPNLTYMVASLNIFNAEIVESTAVRAPARKENDIRDMKVWCVPYLTDGEFEAFKARSNASEIKNLNITEDNIASLVFIRKENLLGYIDYSLTHPPVTREPPVDTWRSSARQNVGTFQTGNRFERTDRSTRETYNPHHIRPDTRQTFGTSNGPKGSWRQTKDNSFK